MVYRPEDILDDQSDTRVIKGVSIRKGTVAAFFQNVNIVSDEQKSAAEKAAAFAIMKELAPALVALDISKHVRFNNPEIQKLFE